MGLELYMLGLTVQDMPRSVAFYRQVGLDIPAGSEEKTHVEVKMSGGLTFFLDSRPTRWDPTFARNEHAQPSDNPGSYPMILEFYLKERSLVDAKYQELTSHGYQSYHAPYVTSFGMYFAMIKDPDGNTVLLSGNLE